MQWCYRLYYKLFRAEYGMQSGPAMIDALKQRLETWNAVQDRTVTYDTVSGEHVVAICTPLMKNRRTFSNSPKFGGGAIVPAATTPMPWP